MIKDIILKYNRPGPRYTSYPPANFFHQEFKTEDYHRALVQSNFEKPENISIYVHVPFCPKMCHFCGCNTDKLDNKETLEQYFDSILKEINSVAGLLNKNRIVTQIHWGGGTPNSVPFKYIEKVMARLQELFRFSENAEIAMECSPAYLTKDYIFNLKKAGFNRISLGIQDLKLDVLEAVNRSPARYPIEEMVADIREAGFTGLNIDLIYGLPLQTKESFLKTIKEIVKLKPNRLVTFSYAHVPWVKDSQNVLEKLGLPSPEDKLDMFLAAFNELIDSGYISIGMDHYALPDDELAFAKREKLLHRNFQGYCTKETTGQVYAFGSTGISQLHGAYSQSIKNTSQYIKEIQENNLATERGYQLTEKDIIVRKVINEVMCNGFLNFSNCASELSISVEKLKEIIKFDIAKFEEFKNDNLLEISEEAISINETGMMIVRNIAMAFDPDLAVNTNQYSKTI